MKLWMIGMVLGIAVGCGGEPSLEEKCEDFGDAFCDRAVECLPGAQGMHDACFSAYKAQVSCSRTKQVTSSYDSCMDQIESVSCGSLFGRDAAGDPTTTLPAACVKVILIGDGGRIDDAISRAVVRGMLDRR